MVEPDRGALSAAYTTPSASPFIYFRPADVPDLERIYKVEETH
jgi:hypothetical protein